MAEHYDPPKPRNTLLERLGGRPPDPEPDNAVREAFNPSRPNSEDDLMLDIRLSNGSRCAFSYSSLFKILFNPEDRLKLAFASDVVVIVGRRLLPLYDLLRRHRAKFVQEGTAAEDGLKPEDAAHIDNIHFEKPEEENDL
jgi:hypothetical protein